MTSSQIPAQADAQAARKNRTASGNQRNRLADLQMIEFEGPQGSLACPCIHDADAGLCDADGRCDTEEAFHEVAVAVMGLNRGRGEDVAPTSVTTRTKLSAVPPGGSRTHKRCLDMDLGGHYSDGSALSSVTWQGSETEM